MELSTPQPAYHTRTFCCNASHNHSTPIEIPRRKSSSSSFCIESPTGRPSSPELIFAMSPVSSDVPLSSLSTISVPKMNDQEPFLYHFPMLPADRAHPTLNRFRPTPHSAAALVTSSSSTPIQNVTNTQLRRKERLFAAHRKPSQDNRQSHHSSAATQAIRMTPVKKIIGFTPTVSNQPSTPVTIRPAIHLAQPSRYDTPFSSPPWMLPGGRMESEGTSSDESDPFDFEFERYLSRRIENERPVRIRRARPMSSGMRFSVRP